MSDGGAMDVAAILRLLPHRFPMLLVDRVVSLDRDERIHAVKAVSVNEPFFPGHFPAHPVMPGVLIVEALAQAAGVLAIESMGLADSGKLVYFMAIENAKFRRPVAPGHLLDLHVDIVQAKRTVCRFTGRAEVEGALSAEASFTAMIADAPAG